ncbi:MAG TPA: NAD(P)/FAD-dependent oxidoreductase, partial [Trebonia sp.]|nr:NAD(P)/FAD-dependent oxidoreductase [Trebonia sp.]
MTDSPHVIIAGAGFAGLSAVGQLRKAGFRVTVIDKNLYSTFQPLLYQVATGGLNPGDVSYAVGGFTSRRRTRYVRGDLAGIDQAARRVRLSDGRELGYDYLMIATGVAANYYGLPGAEENTFGLYTRADAIVLRDHVMNGFERLSESGDPNREFVITVVGGGATGVELAGTAAELRREVIQSTFPDVDPARVHVRLIEMASALVMPFHPKLREYTRKQLVNRGVDIKLNTEIREVRPDCVVLSDGQDLPTDLTVWTAGVAGPHAMANWGLPLGKGGRVLVGPDLLVEGSDRIFAIGDIALNSRAPDPQLAQPAIQHGKHAARQVARLVRGEPTEAFHYHDKGTMATIGRRSAIVELPRGVRFTGTLAWLAWLGLHLLYLLGG